MTEINSENVMGNLSFNLPFSSVHVCEIPLRMPSLNTYINECRKNKYAGAKLKAEIEKEMEPYIRSIPHYDKPVRISFIWYEENKRRDLDGIAFGKKFILDAMVKYGVLTDDSRKYVTGFTDSFEYAKESKVVLMILEVDDET